MKICFEIKSLIQTLPKIFQIWIHFLPVFTNFINNMVYFVCSFNLHLIYHNIYLLFGSRQSSDIVSIMICYFQMGILQKNAGMSGSDGLSVGAILSKTYLKIATNIRAYFFLRSLPLVRPVSYKSYI